MKTKENSSAKSKESESFSLYKDYSEEILALIKGHVPIIWVQTHEESRFVQNFVQSVAKPSKRQVWLWSSYQGLMRYDAQTFVTGSQASGKEGDTQNPQKALKRITELETPADCKGLCIILRDFHTVLGEAVQRQMKDIYDFLSAQGITLIITSPVISHGIGGTKDGLPVTMEKQIAIVEYALPNKEQIVMRIKAIIEHLTKNKSRDTKIRLSYSTKEINEFARALQGLTMLEIDDAMSTSITHSKEINLRRLIISKKQIIRKNEILEFIEQKVSEKDVGGLDQAKTYLSKYAKAHSDEAKAFGVEPLRGVLLTGIPGTGKSLLAKAIGDMWKLPLLRLDVGRVMSSLVGSSEGKMRDVIKQAEAMAPCVTGDTLIQTESHGSVTARDLHRRLTNCQNTEKVFIKTLDPSTNGYKIVEIQTVIRRAAPNKKLIKITTSSGKEIIATENHKFLVKSNSGFFWREVGDLTTEDNLVEFDK